MTRLCLIGTLPPPIGGVTVHIRRLTNELDSVGYGYNFMDVRKSQNGSHISKTDLLRKYLSIRKNGSRVIHYQLNKWTEILTIYLLKNRKQRLIATIHSFRYWEFSFIDKLSCMLCRNLEISYIAPSESLKKTMLNRGFSDEKITVLDTYLPPTTMEKREKIPFEISNFIEKAHANNGYIVLGNAFKLYVDVKGRDVYGLDLCIKACERIPDMYLIFCMPQYDNIYLEQCRKVIDSKKLSNRILLYTEVTNLVPIYPTVNTFARPTITDSFGISVAEAIDCDIPAVASDVCERAEGTIVYKTSDVDDFCAKLTFARNYKVESHKPHGVSSYLKIYNN